jgi:predicted transcriptional regulator of viral defense system
MTRRGATAAIILTYLTHERAIGPMIRYMQRRHGIGASAVYTQVQRLTNAGKIERIERGRYRRLES